MASSPSAKQLDAVAHDLAQVRRRSDALLTQVSDAQWATRPGEQEWSVAECIAHLNLTSDAMVPRIRAALTEARDLPGVGERAYAHSTLGWILAKTVGPAPRLAGVTIGRVRTAPAFVPHHLLPRDETVAEFRRWRGEQEDLVRDSVGLAIDRVKIESPFRAGTYYDGWSSLVILARHELRHLVQAERALDALSAK